jgi:elongation factor Ts
MPAPVLSRSSRTSAGMMDCKKALSETGGDMQAAIDWLRKKGLAAAAKKSGRVAAEGLIGVATGPNVGAMVEVNAETDFVARNEMFQNFVAKVAEIALSVGEDVEAIKSATWPTADLVEETTTAHTVQDELTRLIATVGENMAIRRARVMRVQEGIVASYVHNAVRPGLGKIGVLVALEGKSEAEVMLALGRQIGMHIAAARPEYLDIAGVDPAALERERAVLMEQAAASGKPPAVIEKMVEGRIRKFYEEVVLLEQVWVHDGESRVKAVVQKAGVTCTGFARFQLGEGIEKQQTDFAAEVAAAARG